VKEKDLPVIAGLRSIKMEMEPGIYLWCTCGLSKNQPFCDKSHIGTSFLPLTVIIEEKQMVKWCTCKQTTTPPYCDHSHRHLPGYESKK